MTGLLSGKTAVITGAGSPGGIGRATARLFAAEGAACALTDIDEAGLEEAAAEMGPPHRTYVCDVADAASVKGTTADIAADLGRIDILVNNAGIVMGTPFDEISEDEFDSVLGVNLKGNFLMAQACLPAMRDGGGAIVVVAPEVMKSLNRPKIKILGAGEAPKHQMGGQVDLTYSGARWSGPAAFAEAGVTPKDIKYASIYDSFTITVLMLLEDLGFCPKGEGGRWVAEGHLRRGGRHPLNTDGGGLSSCHPGMRGIFLLIEATRQLRGQAGDVQVTDAKTALCCGSGGWLSAIGAVILGNQQP